MKEATGELNMTVITIVALAAILAFFWVLWPTIKEQINGQWQTATNGGNDPTAYIVK